jgi:hypothetical protein
VLLFLGLALIVLVFCEAQSYPLRMLHILKRAFGNAFLFILVKAFGSEIDNT